MTYYSQPCICAIARQPKFTLHLNVQWHIQIISKLKKLLFLNHSSNLDFDCTIVTFDGTFNKTTLVYVSIIFFSKTHKLLYV